MTINRTFTDLIEGATQRRDAFTDIIKDCESELITDLFQEIRAAVTEQDLLTLSVNIVYRVLRCDRVVVYSLKKVSQGEIIAEAVNPRFSRTLGSIIKDPCFEARYTEKYQQGRTRAIANIYESGMTPCYVENLKKIQVKANLVVPICDLEGSLYGLLVAHQCSDFRQWNQPEIDFTHQVASWTGEKLSEWNQQQHLKTKLEQMAQWNELIVEFTKEVHQRETATDALQLAVERVRETLNCDRVVVYGLQQQNIGKIIAESKIPMLASILNCTIEDPCFEYMYIDKYRDGRVTAIANIYEAGMSSCYIETLEKIAVKSTLVVPINLDNGNIYGLAIAHQCFRFRVWQTEEIEWFKQIGLQTGLSLSKAKLKERVEQLQSKLTEMEVVRDTLTISKSKIEQIKQPLLNIANSLNEINNLNKLLNREFNANNGSAFPQLKHTKLIPILLKKLSFNFIELKKSYNTLHVQRNDFEELLEKTTTKIYAQSSEDKLGSST